MDATRIYQEHWLDEHDRPEGGCTFGVGFAISWQHGPLGRGDDRREPNGAFVEAIIKAAIGRIHFYNLNGFDCDENHEAIQHLEAALDALNSRTSRRERQGVEGTHEGS